MAGNAACATGSKRTWVSVLMAGAGAAAGAGRGGGGGGLWQAATSDSSAAAAAWGQRWRRNFLECAHAGSKESDVWLIIAEALLALGLLVFIVWWTMFHGKRKPPRDE